MVVFDDAWNEWILAKEDYEIAYEWLDGNDVAADWDIIAKLNLQITPELEKEWIAREISRFLNQMRKDADYNIDARVNMYYETNNDYAIYTFDQKDQDGNIKDYVSRVRVENGEYYFDTITDEKEWEIVKETISKIEKGEA